MITPIFSVFKTIKVGSGPKTADEFRTALKDVGCKTSVWANEILAIPAFTVASREADVDLVVVATAQLTGKSDGGTTRKVFAGAARFGLDKCAPDDGPEFRRQYLDQPFGEWLQMGMEPIARSHDRLGMFGLGHGSDGLWLGAIPAFPGHPWRGDTLWVFRRPKLQIPSPLDLFADRQA